MHIPRIVCGNCDLEMTILQTGHTVEMETSSGPYYKISSDIYQCHGCNHLSMLLASRPIVEHYQDGYDTVLASTKARFIN
jgi:hypothetical protein